MTMDEGTHGPPIDLHARIAELRQADPNWQADVAHARAIKRNQQREYLLRSQDLPAATLPVFASYQLHKLQTMIERNEARVTALAARVAQRQALPHSPPAVMKPQPAASGGRLPGIAREFS